MGSVLVPVLIRQSIKKQIRIKMRRYSIKNGKINIDDKEIEFLEGETILEAANRANIYIPRLCYIEGLAPYGGCRLCIVKVKGIRGFTTACTTPAIDGMKIKNNEQEVQYYRKEIFKLLLSEHPHACIVCQNKNNCEELRINIDKFGRTLGCFTCASKDTCSLRKIAEYLGIYDVPYNL